MRGAVLEGPALPSGLAGTITFYLAFIMRVSASQPAPPALPAPRLDSERPPPR